MGKSSAREPKKYFLSRMPRRSTSCSVVASQQSGQRHSVNNQPEIKKQISVFCIQSQTSPVVFLQIIERRVQDVAHVNVTWKSVPYVGVTLKNYLREYVT